MYMLRAGCLHAEMFKALKLRREEKKKDSKFKDY